ncbi:winged helix-turn-helix transcriptional regulator [Microtetraspora malaysiensis]|uniref:winged helix-turn-helix transcriptional regulator n=1 Tax=Microtetraspora malaysiensis TaxID=161358 RepID=UPI003D91B8B5
MLGRLYDNEVCSAARALEIVGERWSLLIIRNAMFTGATRFSEFQRALRIAPNILTSRLQRFVEAGLMETRPQPDAPEVHEYVLTDKGLDLQPVIIALTHWGDRWAAPDGPPIIYRHDGCGGPLHQHLTCDACGATPTSAEVGVLRGPGMPPGR